MVSELSKPRDQFAEIYAIQITEAEEADKYIIYRPLAGLAFVGNRAMVNLTRALANDAAAVMAQNEPADFLRRIGFLDPDPPGPAIPDDEFAPTTAVLLLTNQCQLRCTYCYAAAGEATPQELSLDLGKAAIDYVYETAQRLGRQHFEISFHGGGEPTLAWKTIEACVAYARAKPLTAKIKLTSNGIWSAKKREWLLTHLDSLSLSMDGSPQTQDHQRPYISGRGSSQVVMETIAALDQRKFPYGIRMTATAPWEQFPRDVAYLCETTKCPSIQVEPAFNIQRGGHVFPDVNQARAFARAFLDAHDIATKAGRRLLYSGARLGQVTSAFCLAPYNALVVNANGDLVTCYEVASNTHPLTGLSVIGKVINGSIEIDQAARTRLHMKMAERRAACKNCYCYWSCAGDCYVRTFGAGDGGHLQYGARCESNRFIMEKLLLNAIAVGDGLWDAKATLPASSVSI